MTQHLDDITAKIATIVIAGVTIYDLGQIPDAVTLRGGQTLLMPEPMEFVTNLAVVPDTLGYADTRILDLQYDLTYSYFYAPVGSGRGLRDHYAGLAAKWQAIVHGICNTDFADVGGIRVLPNAVQAFGKIPDPLGNEFFGFRLVLHCNEYMRN